MSSFDELLHVAFLRVDALRSRVVQRDTWTATGCVTDIVPAQVPCCQITCEPCRWRRSTRGRKADPFLEGNPGISIDNQMCEELWYPLIRYDVIFAHEHPRLS